MVVATAFASVPVADFVPAFASGTDEDFVSDADADFPEPAASGAVSVFDASADGVPVTDAFGNSVSAADVSGWDASGFTCAGVDVSGFDVCSAFEVDLSAEAAAAVFFDADPLDFAPVVVFLPALAEDVPDVDTVGFDSAVVLAISSLAFCDPELSLDSVFFVPATLSTSPILTITVS